MYIKPEISYNSGRLFGYAENQADAEAATTILTIMMQSVCGGFRDIVACFPVKKLTGDNETEYLKDAIMMLERIGLVVLCVICDNSNKQSNDEQFWTTNTE